MRFFERFANQPNVHISDVDFFDDTPDFIKRKRSTFKLPAPFDLLFSSIRSFDDFTRLIEIIDDQDRQLERSSNRSGQDDLIALLVLWSVFHELAHVLRGHFEIRKSTRDDERENAQRGMEVDADAWGGYLLARSRTAQVINGIENARQLEALIESSWRCSYAIAAFFGMIRISDYRVTAFSTGSYHHPSARAQIAIMGTFQGFAELLPPEFVKLFLVPVSGDAANEYNSRVNQFWLSTGCASTTRRPSSFYVPMLPFGGGSNLPFMQYFESKDLPSLQNLYYEARKTHERFTQKFQEMLHSL
jgi:hypothetical protein